MIKILKPGDRATTSCQFCGAILSYQREDIREREKFLSQRESKFIKYIICPQCRSSVDLNGGSNEVSINKSN